MTQNYYLSYRNIRKYAFWTKKKPAIRPTRRARNVNRWCFCSRDFHRYLNTCDKNAKKVSACGVSQQYHNVSRGVARPSTADVLYSFARTRAQMLVNNTRTRLRVLYACVQKLCTEAFRRLNRNIRTINGNNTRAPATRIRSHKGLRYNSK